MVLEVEGSNPSSRPKESIAYGNSWTNQTFALRNLDAMARIRKRLTKLHKINLIDCTLSVPYGVDISRVPAVEFWRVPSSGMFTKLVLI